MIRISGGDRDISQDEEIVVTRNKKNKLDFRFADEEDLDDIFRLVSRAYAVEIGETGVAFKNCERYSREQVELQLNGGWAGCNWVVLETQPPEEEVAAVALLRMDLSVHEGVVLCLAVHPALQRRGIGTYLLVKVESIFENYACKYSVLQASEWRTDVEDWLKKQSYKEMGGGLWPDEEKHTLSRPSRYCLYKKNLQPLISSDASAAEKSFFSCTAEENTLATNVQFMEPDSTQTTKDEIKEEKLPPPPTEEHQETLEDLLTTLMRALHTPEGREELKRLSAEQQQAIP